MNRFIYFYRQEPSRPIDFFQIANRINIDLTSNAVLSAWNAISLFRETWNREATKSPCL